MMPPRLVVEARHVGVEDLAGARIGARGSHRERPPGDDPAEEVVAHVLRVELGAVYAGRTIDDLVLAAHLLAMQEERR